MRVLLDTNVLLAALATRGLCADLLRLVLAEHELVVVEQLIEEFERHASTKLRLPEHLLIEARRFLRAWLQSVPDVKVTDVCRYPDDTLLLAAAQALDVDCLVSGDKDLVDIAGKVSRPRIMTPREFWRAVQNQ